MRKRPNRPLTVLLGVAILILVAIGVYHIPFVHSKLAWRLNDLQTQIYYFFNPPEQVDFLPTQQDLATVSPRPTQTSTPVPVVTTESTPTVTNTPAPQAVILDNVTYIDQMNRYNYCGPANLAMALTYWGWTGEPGNSAALRDQIGAVIKPGVDDPSLSFIDRSQTDVNVMPYEMVDYVNDHTTLRALFRYGGDIDLLKRLIAAGFPVIAEKGIYQKLPPEWTLQWAGHYAFTTGYDDTTQKFIYQDSYAPDTNKPFRDQGYNVHMSYADYIRGWRAFDYVFIIVYPADREDQLFQVLGNWLDESWAAQNAAQIAQQETQTLTGVDQFFAYFGLGTSDYLLTEYGQAALAYDQAFALYNQLPTNDANSPRPYRIMWYQTGPYWAYYYTSRYQDVVTMADATEKTLWGGRVLEETLYWRAQAEAQLGYYDKAYADLRKAVHYNPNFGPGISLMAKWGISP